MCEIDVKALFMILAYVYMVWFANARRSQFHDPVVIPPNKFMAARQNLPKMDPWDPPKDFEHSVTFTFPPRQFSSPKGLVKSGKNSKIKMEIYMESLCGDTYDFFQFELLPVLRLPGFGKMFAITVFPYGKANMTGKDNVVCHHKEEECITNRYILCGIHSSGNDSEIYIPFIACCIGKTDMKELALCASHAGLPHVELLKCQNSSQGQKLHIAAGKVTKAKLNQVTWVPTISMNGVVHKSISSVASNFFKDTVCEMLGKDRHDECDSVDVETYPRPQPKESGVRGAQPFEDFVDPGPSMLVYEGTEGEGESKEVRDEL